MIKVETLSEAGRGSVWRCPAFTVAWIDGQWCRRDRHDWTPLATFPSGPFFEIENPDLSDYRDSLFRFHALGLL